MPKEQLSKRRIGDVLRLKCAHRLALSGDSMRKPAPGKKTSAGLSAMNPMQPSASSAQGLEWLPTMLWNRCPSSAEYAFCSRRRTVPAIRQKFALLISMGFSSIRNLFGFSDGRRQPLDFRDL